MSQTQSNYVVSADRTAMWTFRKSDTVDDIASMVAINWKKSRQSFVLMFGGRLMTPGYSTLKSLGIHDKMSFEVVDVQRRWLL